MTRNQLLELARKNELGTVTPEEQNALFYFLNTVQETNSHLDGNPTPQTKKRIAEGLESKINRKLDKIPFFRSRIFAVAALFIGILSIGALTRFLANDTYKTAATEKGEKRTLVLEDGSKVFLNSNSSITYPEDFTANRTIQLTGEAFFEVHRDEAHPFTIKTGAIKTQVLGTTFNINSYDLEEVLVSVNSGKVSVENTKTHTQVYLTKNKQVVFKGNENPLETQTDSEDQIAWTRNIISLHNTSLLKTAEILENWYDVNIDFEHAAISELKITGKFKDESLKNVLKSIALINNLKIDTLTQKHFLIRKNTTN